LIRAISPTSPACYGMAGCPHHKACQRYAAVEGASPDHTVGTCRDAAGEWPLLSVVKTVDNKEGVKA
jgi:hypothetical protein